MPDLNWRNPEVREAMIEVAKFWVEKGIDGLRLDAFIHIAKGNLRQNYPTDSTQPVVAEPMFANLPNVVTYLQEFINELRKINADLFILGEGASADPNLAALYTRKTNGRALCDAIVSFRNLPKKKKTATSLSTTLQLPQPEVLDVASLPVSIVEWQTTLAQTTQPTLYFSNHDLPRMATAYGDPQYPTESLKTLATMLYLQKGIPIIYYGEELGLKSAELTRFSAFQDQTVTDLEQQVPEGQKQAVLKALSKVHKTAARQAMSWDQSSNNGFSTHEPWLRVAPASTTVAQQESNQDSILNFYRRLLKLKQQSAFAIGDFELLNAPTSVIMYQRKSTDQSSLVITNLSQQEQTVTLPYKLTEQPQLITGNWQFKERELLLGPWASVVFVSQNL